MTEMRAARERRILELRDADVHAFGHDLRSSVAMWRLLSA